MREYKKCNICKEFHWNDVKCSPKYSVYYEEYMGNEPKTIYATSFDEAAQKFAEYYNTKCDYILMGESIKVRVEKDGITKWFNVGAEPDIHYFSREVNETEKEITTEKDLPK